MRCHGSFENKKCIVHNDKLKHSHGRSSQTYTEQNKKMSEPEQRDHQSMCSSIQNVVKYKYTFLFRLSL